MLNTTHLSDALHLQAFKESCREFYWAELQELSFVRDAMECRKYINEWVAEKTAGERFHFSRHDMGKEKRAEVAWGMTSWALQLGP